MITPRPLFANNQLQTLSVIFAGTPDRRLAGMSNLPSCCGSALSAAVKRDRRAAGKKRNIPWGVNVKIILEGDHYARFRADLLAHRDRFPLNDADYVDQVLKISLNTFKKCVNAAG